MTGSRDPIHDLDHIKRVVAYVETFAKKTEITEKERQALILAAWWHDVSRTIGSGTSIVFLSLIDDLVSATMLWFITIRYGLFNSVAGMATRIIFCKSLGAGAILTKILLRKRQRLLVDMLKDADNLDAFHVERVERLLMIAGKSRLHRYGYRVAIRWYVRMNQLMMKTKAAQECVLNIIRQLLEWMKTQVVYAWHLRYFGEVWVQETIQRIIAVFDRLCVELQMRHV